MHPKKGKSYYPLAEIRQRIEVGGYYVRGKAKSDAKECFQYSEQQILATILGLEEANFYKTIDKPLNVEFTLDVYRVYLQDARKTAYIKFGVNDEHRVVVSVMSFKDKEN